jgi:hypothetical protein
MGNRYMNQFQYTLEQDSVTLFGGVNIGPSGAVASIYGYGIESVSLIGTGVYDVVFTDKWSQLLDFDFKTFDDADSAIAKVQLFEAPESVQADVKADRTLRIKCLNFSGAAAEPANGAQIKIKAVFRYSSYSKQDQ